MGEMQEIGASLATINKIQTTVDGGARITLDIPEINHEIASRLLKLKMQGDALLQVGFVQVKE